MVNSPPLPHTEKCCPRPLLDTRWRVNEVKPRQGVRKSQIRGAGLASLLHCCRAALLPSRRLPCTGYYCADSKRSGKQRKDGVGPVGKTLHPLLCRRRLPVGCFCFFKLFCCLLQNYTKTIHVDEDGYVDDVDVSVSVGVALRVDFLKRKANGEGSVQKQRR